MGRIFQSCFAVALCLIAGAGLAGADTITQTYTFGTTDTDVTAAQTSASFNYFESAGAPVGAQLQSVDISVSLNVTLSSLNVYNLDETLNAATENFSYLAYTGLDFYSTGPTAEASALAAGVPSFVVLFSIGGGQDGATQQINENQVFNYIGPVPTTDPGSTPPNQALPPGVITNPNTVCATPPCTALSGSGSDNYSASYGNGIGGTNDVPNYTYLDSIATSAVSNYDTTGTFTMAYDTNTSYSISGNGGNFDLQSLATTTGTYTVTYTYDVPGAPEPGTWLLMGTGLLAAVVFRHRLAR